MSERTIQLVHTIRDRLGTTIRRITLAELAVGALLTLGILSALWTVATGVEAVAWLGVVPRTVLFYVLLGAAVGLTAYFIAVPLLRLAGVLGGPSEETVARRIGTRYPEVADRLLNLLDLSDGRRSPSPNALVDGAVRRLASDVEPVAFEQVEDFSRVRRAGRLAALPVLALLVFLLAAPGTFLNTSHRLLSPGERFTPPAPFRFAVSPGAARLVKGDSLEIEIAARGNETPDRVTLALNNMDEEHVENVQLTAGPDGRFHHTIINVRTPLRYRVQTEPVTSRWFAVELTERPLLRTLNVTLDFPDYTGIPSQRLDPNVGDVKALPGTRVILEAQTGGTEVSEAFVRFNDGARDTLTLDGATAEGGFTLRNAGSYQIVLRNARGVENRAPISYSLQLLSDELPSISMLAPASPAELDESLQQGLRARMSDDFGFATLRLYYRLAESKQDATTGDFKTIELSLDNPRQLDQEISYNWLLKKTTALDPVPGDVIEYFLRVWDNDAVAGYKSAQTSVQRLRVPSLDEQYEQVEEQQSQTEEQLEDALRETEDVQKDFQELRDELQRKTETGWEDKRQLEQLQERQQEVEKRVEEISQQMESLTREMEKNSLVSEETLNLYKELQRVMDEVNSPELQEAMRKLQEAMQNMSPKQMQEALQNTQFNEQQYKNRLERATELFKKIKMQQKLEEAARRAEELAEQQQRLSEETKQRLDRENAQKQGAKNRDENGNAQKPADAKPQDAASEKAKDPQKKSASEKEQAGEQKEGRQQAGEKSKSGAQESERRQAENQNKPGNRKDQKSEQNTDAEQRANNQQGETNRQKQGQKQQTGRQQQGAQRPKSSKELAQEQKQASEAAKELEKQLDKLRKEMDSLRSAPKQEMKQFQQQMRQQQLPQKMKQNSQQLQQNQLQKAQQGQKQMQQQLRQMAQRLQRMQKNMQGQQRQMNLASLRQALSDILTLSQQQEGLRMGVRGAASDNPQLRTYAQRQEQLSEGLRVVSDSLQRLAKDVPQMRREVQEEAGQALREMNSATDELTDRRASQATNHQKGSMMHLNELGLMLSDLLDQMNQSGGGGGSMSMQQLQQQLKQMAGQQQQLNKQIQKMLNDTQGNRLSVDQQKRLQQMAQQQRALQRELEKLSRNREVQGKTLGDLKKVAEQMDESINEMRRRQVDPETIERQRQIHTRLLDAQRSIHKRGKSQKRKGTTGDDLQRESPEEVTPSEQAEQLRRALIRALENGYAPDYEELIKRYFELLQQQEN